MGARQRDGGPAGAAIAFEHSPAGMAISDDAKEVRGANPTLARWCGRDARALIGRDLADLVHPGDASALALALSADAGAPGGAEVRLLAGEQERWVRLVVASVPAGAAGPGLRVVHVEDIAERRATTQRSTHDARHDDLTGLPNRRAMMAELAALVAAPERGGAVLMVDLDGFKAVDDLFGHDAGDELLQVVADRLRGCLRPGDVAGRLGGDEMRVIAREVADDAGARALGHRVLDSLVGPAALRAGAVGLLASIGLRRIADGDRDAAALTRDADAALYRAKADGGCCVRLARPGESDASASAVRFALAAAPAHRRGSRIGVDLAIMGWQDFSTAPAAHR